MHERPDDVSTELVAERPRQFPGQSLEAQGKRLWCACCGSEVSSAKSAIGKHIKGKGHKAKLVDYNLRELKKGEVASALLASRRARQVQGVLDLSTSEGGSGGGGGASAGAVGVQGMETVPMNAQVFRYNVLGGFLEAAVPITRLNKKKFRTLLEGGRGKLTRGMKDELHLHKACIAQIRPIEERLDEDGKGTFNIQSWWRESKVALPAWSKTLRAVLCHAPNSAPPERAFSILNNAIGDQQLRARADYKKATMQLQFNSRGRDE